MVSAASERTWTAERAPLWDELAELVAETRRDGGRMPAERVDLLVLRYQQTAADLALLRTRDPSSPLLPRLNDLVAQAHSVVYRRGTAPLRSVLGFLWSGYPALVWELRRPIAAAALLGVAVAAAGFAWALADPVSASSFLPAGLRDANHARHEAIPASLMAPESALIFTNNIRVSIMAFGNQTLSALKSDEFRRCATQPARQVVERETASFALRPNNRQAQLQRRNATPGLQEIATLSQLHFGWTR